MKTLLLGHNGYLGSYLYKYLDCDIATGRWGRGVSSDHYDLVINCIAKSDIHWCEDYPFESLNTNAALVNDLCLMYPEAKIVNFSSYYVYDTPELATEESPLAKASLQYIQHKIIGESWNPNGINFRIGKLFGNPSGHQNRLTEHILKEDYLELDTHRFNPCSCECILKTVMNHDFILNNKGTFNLANEGVTTPIEYANFILKYLKKDTPIKEVKRLPIKNFYNYGKFAMSLDKIKQHLELDPWEKDMEKYLCCLV